MCGRYNLITPPYEIARRLELDQVQIAELPPRYNIAPRTWIAVIRSEPGEEPDTQRLILMSALWGFRPAWAKRNSPQPINARAETVGESPYYRQAFAARRCLMPADGWYEWRMEAGRKQPYYFTTGDLMLLAGIWTATAEGEPSCAILTEPARGAAQAIHSRMPVVIEAGSWRRWLDPRLQEREEIRAAIRHMPAEALRCWPVSTRVNSVRNDDRELIEPLPGSSEGVGPERL
ncbi:MAG TPA: SOS response-associated peptidase [Nitrococcus sp.]|nr:SOS response-associated peptidase [Nitrococcus sp.]